MMKNLKVSKFSLFFYFYSFILIRELFVNATQVTNFAG